MTTFEHIASTVDAQLPTHRSQLEDLVRIPSVSADSFDQAQVRRSAEAVAELARARGLDTEVIQLHTASGKVGRPAVLAHRPASSGKPTILL